MSFPVAAYLRKATSRAKSDVANKLVSMFLHDLSRKICASINLSVTDPRYASAVEAAFGSNCCYCNSSLEADRAAVEHLDGMNRFRLGLHVPGNVALACKRCNTEKRRDDQLLHLNLGEFGWESFLSHDGSRCKINCKSCLYWRSIWNEPDDREERLANARQKITEFRSHYPDSLRWNRVTREFLGKIVGSLYRDCQTFATTQIETIAEKTFASLREAVGLPPAQ